MPAPQSLTNADLQKIYRKLNKRWFGGQLPPIERIVFANLDADECDGMYEPADINRPARLSIDKNLRKHHRLVIAVMLHEMVHVLLYDCEVEHGQRFQTEIWRLIQAGAYENLL